MTGPTPLPMNWCCGLLLSLLVEVFFGFLGTSPVQTAQYEMKKYNMLKTKPRTLLVQTAECILPLSESSLSEESLLPEDEDPVFIFVTFGISRGFSAAKKSHSIQRLNRILFT